MAKKVTRIKANESPTEDKKPAKQNSAEKSVEATQKNQPDNRGGEATKAPSVHPTKKEAKQAKKREKQASGKKPFILIRPFVAFFRYLRDAWKEIRQVRWPNRKATWKMVLAVLVYTVIFVVLISLLDLLFTWLFSLIIK